MNITNTNTILEHILMSSDVEIINMAQSAVSLVCSLIILCKLFDVSSFFSSVRRRRDEHRKKKQKEEYNRLKLMFKSLQENKEISFTSEEEEEQDKDAGVMKIARKKKTHAEEKV